jgi:hypothetical protein
MKKHAPHRMSLHRETLQLLAASVTGAATTMTNCTAQCTADCSGATCFATVCTGQVNCSVAGCPG